MLPKLDERLSLAASFVQVGQAVADIGCDHGKLAVNLAASGQFPKVIAADLRPGPLAKAALTLQKAGCESLVELRLGDGLSVLAEGEVGTIIIAGVSAQTTIDILSAAPWVCGQGAPRLVLVPATKHHVLRGWLCEQGFALLRDCPVQAAGRWYTVIAAEYTGERTPIEQIPLEQLIYGNTTQEEHFAAYAALELGKLKKERLRLPDDDPRAQEMDAMFAVAHAVLPANQSDGTTTSIVKK